VIGFGLTGGLIPCGAAITVLLLCLQLGRFWLGMLLVLCFSIGLAVTLAASGVAAAWGVRHVARRWSGLEPLMRRAPYLSSAVLLLLALVIGVQGWTALPQ
jgi:nickel/cobalt exporter